MPTQGYRSDDSAALIREHSDKAHEVRRGKGGERAEEEGRGKEREREEKGRKTER